VLWLYLQRETDLRSRELDVLHFAPEPSLASLLSGLPNLRYRSGDLQPGAAMEVMDMTAIPAADESFDLVLCNHVLEHVPDDLAAMRELRRVLRRGGAAITQHPVEWGRERTFEDPSITAPEDRLRAFGQEDHVRVYGPDFLDRWRTAGFEPELRRYRDELPPAEVERMRLDDGCRAGAGRRYTGDDIVICRRTA
jgi:SAM-dependent methyltransferase